MTPPASPQLDDLLAASPGDGISVSRDGDKIHIHLRGGGPERPGWLNNLIAVATALTLIASILLLNVLEESIGESGWVVYPILLVGLVGYSFGARRYNRKPAILRHLQTEIELDPEHLRIREAGIATEFAWRDIHTLRVMRMEQSAEQLHAQRSDPFVQGEGDGIALVTRDAIYQTLDFWHHDVSKWMANVLSSYSGVSLSEDNSIDDLLRETPRRKPKSYLFPRSSLMKTALFFVVFGGFASLTILRVHQDWWEVDSWRSVPGVVVSREQTVSDGSGDNSVDRWHITYEYEVDGATYTNDRFHIALENEQTDQQKSQLHEGDSIEVLRVLARAHLKKTDMSV